MGFRVWGSGGTEFGGQWGQVLGVGDTARTDPTVSPCWQRAALDLDNVYMKYMLMVAVLVLGHLVVRRFFTP